MVTVWQKLGLATKKLKKSTEDSKILCEDERLWRKLNYKKAN